MSSSSPIVIAGGTGFLGRRLAASLAGAGYEIVVLSRRPPGERVGPVRFQLWDPQVPQGDWSTSLEGSAALINLCGESIGEGRWTDARKRLLIDSRTTATTALVSAVNACASPPPVFVQISGTGFYGIGERECDEHTGPGNDFLAGLAQRWEAPLEDLRPDVRPVVARLGVVLGKNGGALKQMLLPFRLFVGGPLASGRQWLSWIHLHDVSSAIAFLIASPEARGVFNLTAPAPVRNVDFANAVGTALGRPTWMLTPRFVLKTLLGEQATLVCDGQRAVPERLTRLGYSFTYPTIATALAELTTN